MEQNLTKFSVSKEEVDFGIKKKKKYTNYRKKQYINPVGDKFETPEVCHSHFSDRFSCSTFSIEDALTLRGKIYETTDKITQDKHVSNLVKASKPKRRRPRKDPSTPNPCAHEVQLSYSLEKKDGTRINVCKTMFITATGFSKERIVNIAKQIQRYGAIREKRGGDRRSSVYADQKIIQLVQKTEEELNKFRNHSNHTTDDVDTNEDEIPLAKLTKVKKFSQKEKRRKVPEPEEVLIETELVEPKSEILELELFGLCRICLQNDCELIYLFDQISNEQTNADLVEFCLPLKLSPDDGLPQNICKMCLERVQIACKLKTDCEASVKIIENYIKSAKDSKDKSTNLEQALVPESNPIDNDTEDVIKAEEGDEMDQEFQEFSESDENQMENLENFEEIEENNVEFDASKSENSGTKIRPVRCFLCDCEFDETPEMHFDIYHNQVQQFSCTKCEFQIDNPWYLNLHYQLHSEDIRICENCGKVFTPNSFLNHKAFCCGSSENRKRYQCKFCPSQYYRPYYLKLHERSHTGEKPYVCNLCNVSFMKRPSLRKHMLIHGAEPNFRCEGCSKGFIQKYRLKQHQESCLRNKNLN